MIRIQRKLEAAELVGALTYSLMDASHEFAVGHAYNLSDDLSTGQRVASGMFHMQRVAMGVAYVRSC